MTKKVSLAQSREYLRRVEILAQEAPDVVERRIMPTVYDIYSYPHHPSEVCSNKSESRYAK